MFLLLLCIQSQITLKTLVCPVGQNAIGTFISRTKNTLNPLLHVHVDPINYIQPSIPRDSNARNNFEKSLVI